MYGIVIAGIQPSTFSPATVTTLLAVSTLSTLPLNTSGGVVGRAGCPAGFAGCAAGFAGVDAGSREQPAASGAAAASARTMIVERTAMTVTLLCNAADVQWVGMGDVKGHELVGTRLVGELPTADMVELWARSRPAIVKHGFVIEYRDLEPPRTGIFDGLRIVIDPDVGFEMQCFLLLHLFGHSVQWVAPSIEHKLERPAAHRGQSAVHAGAARLRVRGGRLRHAADARAGVTDLDQWYSDFVETDWRYVERYYETDPLPDWKTCVVSGCR